MDFRVVEIIINMLTYKYNMNKKDIKQSKGDF